MPIYDYACESCGRTIEVMHGVHGHGPRACEVCGGRMRKLLSAPAIHFKGSGWAKKDARASSGGSRSGTRSSSKSGESDGAGGGTGSAGGDAGGSGSTAAE